MAGRSPARFLAPLALAAVVVALYMVVTRSLDDPAGSAPNQATETEPAASPEASPEKEAKESDEDQPPRRYTVQTGDTPSGIAEETGVPLEDILRLNPDLDPQALTPGAKIRLREQGQ
jgi:LysM repeat protein